MSVSTFERNLKRSEPQSPYDATQSAPGLTWDYYVVDQTQPQHAPYINEALLIGRKRLGPDHFPNYKSLLKAKEDSLITEALNANLPPTELPFALFRVSLETITAAAILESRALGAIKADLKPRADTIQTAVDYRNGPWSGIETVYSGTLPRTSTQGLKLGLIDFIMHKETPLEKRIGVMKDYLLTGSHPSIDERAREALFNFNEALITTRFLCVSLKSPDMYEYHGCNIEEKNLAALSLWSLPGVCSVVIEISRKELSKYAKAAAFTIAPIAIVSIKDAKHKPARVKSVTGWNSFGEEYFDAPVLSKHLTTLETEGYQGEETRAKWIYNHYEIESRNANSILSGEDVANAVAISMWKSQVKNRR